MPKAVSQNTLRQGVFWTSKAMGLRLLTHQVGCQSHPHNSIKGAVCPLRGKERLAGAHCTTVWLERATPISTKDTEHTAEEDGQDRESNLQGEGLQWQPETSQIRNRVAM